MGWDVAEHRRQAQRKDELGAMRRHLAVESHLALWGAFAGFAMALVAARLGFELNPIWVLPALLLAVPLAIGLVTLGRRRVEPFPVSYHRLLAPYQGLSVLLTLLASRVGRFAARGKRTTQEPEADSSAPSPREAVRDLAELTVEDVMVPRSQVVSLPAEATARTALREVKGRPYSLYPVFEEAVELPLGIARLLDLSDPKALDRPVREIAQQVPIVPEPMRALAAFGRLVSAPVGAAIVVDEFGSYAGLVTLRGVVELLVGDLTGEHDIQHRRIESVSEGVYRVDGACEVEEFNDEVGPILPEGDYDTVAGLFLELAGRIPQVGDEIAVPNATLEVLERTDRRILSIQIVVSPALETEEDVD
jgi:Mg2+/Co2+ transporter CorC